jgi:hypothetical protein
VVVVGVDGARLRRAGMDHEAVALFFGAHPQLAELAHHRTYAVGLLLADKADACHARLLARKRGDHRQGLRDVREVCHVDLHAAQLSRLGPGQLGELLALAQLATHAGQDMHQVAIALQRARAQTGDAHFAARDRRRAEEIGSGRGVGLHAVVPPAQRLAARDHETALTFARERGAEVAQRLRSHLQIRA